MSLIKWEPFDELDDFFDDFESFESASDVLATDIYEKGGDVIVEMNIPGVDLNKINVEVEDGYLKVSGAHETSSEEKKKDYYSKEIRRGSFQRIIPLPSRVKEDKVDASYDDGVLKVTLPKIAEEKSKKAIKVKVEKKETKKSATKKSTSKKKK